MHRYIETRYGILSYSELAPRLAPNVLALERKIENGEFANMPLHDTLLLEFHRQICGNLIPQFAGWRLADVTVGAYAAPGYFRVPLLMREYGLDLQARLSALESASDELLLEALAFAEGRLLSIHPFADFNGRVTRVWLREILHRLNFPPVQLTPTAAPTVAEYLAALQAADHNDWRPLKDIWCERFEKCDIA